MFPATAGDAYWPGSPFFTGSEIDTTVGFIHSRFTNRVVDPRRHQFKLDIVEPRPNASIIVCATAPVFIGPEFTDLLCGGCSLILSQGVSRESLRDTMAVPVEFIIRCPSCGANNLVPVQGTKRHRPKK